MCDLRTHGSFAIGYANAAMDLFVAGMKWEAAWLIVKSGRTLEQYVNSGMTVGEIVQMTRIFEHVRVIQKREARKAAKEARRQITYAPQLSHSDSAN